MTLFIIYVLLINIINSHKGGVMNESIRKILKLVAEKKISSEDGEKLIREILRHEKENSEEGDTLNV